MRLDILNTTNNVISVCFNNHSEIVLNEQESIRFNDVNQLSYLIICKSNDYNFYKERIKNELVISNFDIMHMSFKMKYYSCLKSSYLISCNTQNNKIKLIINDNIAFDNNFVKLNYYDLKCENCNILDKKYRYKDKNQKLALQTTCSFILLLKYGFLGILGLLFGVYLFCDIANGNVDSYIALSLIVEIILFTFFVLFSFNLFEFRKMLKKIVL